MSKTNKLLNLINSDKTGLVFLKLEEAIFGKLATVYHRTSKKHIDDIINKGFTAGSGNMYGKGIYATYELKSQLRQEMLHYGDIIVKAKLNLYGFLILDQKGAKAVYKNNYKLIDQLKELKINLSKQEEDNIIDIDNSLGKDKFTSDKALKLSKTSLIRKVRGLVFTGRRDGEVAVVYNQEVITPMSYAYSDINKLKESDLVWKKILNYKILKRVLDKELTDIKDIGKTIPYILKEGLTQERLEKIAPWFIKGIKDNKIKVDRLEIKEEKGKLCVLEGHWNSGIWYDGTWYNGTWEDGIWYRGTWNNGTWNNGTWNSGIWYRGTWNNGTWEDGTWNSGIWYRGTWNNGTWNNGTWKNGTWKYGTWYNGTWNSGIWEDGTWYNGNWENGTWKSGTWKYGTWNSGIWYDGTWNSGIWWKGTWNSGIWEDGTWYNGNWENGTWKSGIWYRGTWKDGIWWKGTWKYGTWYNGTWEDGTWKSGYWENGTWKSGTWNSGTWKYGTWYNGTWEDGTWKSGNWENGTWENGKDKQGNIRTEAPNKW